MKKIVFFLLFVSSFARAQTITADQLLLDSLSGIYNKDYKVANDTINIVATKSDLLLKLDASDTTGIWQPLGNYATVSDLNLKVDSVNKKAATDSVFYWINGTSYFAFRDSASAGSGTPSLTQNQIAFGDASNLLTSSSDFTYDNGIFTVNHSANNSGLQFDPVTWMQSENYMNDGDDGWSYFPNMTTAWWRNNGEWVWYDDGTNLLLRMDSGNVGIGTNAPTNTLHVNGSARITALGGGGTQMVTSDNSGVLGVGTIPDLTNYLQSGDNVSELFNDAGYLTSSTGLSTTLANGKFLVGNGSNVATAVTPTGDVTFDNAGNFTIGAGKVTNAMLAGSISNANLANSTISGISLGSNLATLSNGYGIASLSYNGSGSATAIVDSACATCPVSKTRLSNTLGSYTATSSLGSMAFADSTTYHGSTSINTVGTIGTGTWRGTSIDTLYTNSVSRLRDGLWITTTTSGGKAWKVNADSATIAAYLLRRTDSTSVYASFYQNSLKQAALVSGTNIKTVNSNSLLGSGNVAVGDALVANSLSQFASTTSSQLRTVLSDELGTGAALFDGATPTSFVLTNATGLPAASVNSGALASGMTATTQAFGTTNTTLATTAFVLARDTISFLSADTTTAAGVTITIPGLTFTAGANQTWAFDVYIVGQTSSTGGTRFQVVYSTTPTSSTVGYSGYTAATTPTSLASLNTTPPQSTTSWTTGATDLQAHIHATIFNGGTACTVTIKGNPVNGAQTATFRKGSYIIAKRGQ